MIMNKLKSICLYRATDDYLNKFPKMEAVHQRKL